MSNKKSKETSLAFGGQALIEGVMMRSKRHMVLCVRKPNSNEILTNIENLHPIADKYKLLGLPFLRGIVSLFETFYLGVKGLLFSANAALEEEGENSVKSGYKELAVVGAVALGIIAIFLVVPFFLAGLLNLT